jgi:hypothetical protein
VGTGGDRVLHRCRLPYGCILWPLKGWKFTLSPALIASYQKRDVSPREEHIYADAALTLDGFRQRNSDRLEFLYWLFRVATFLLAAGVLAWIVELKGAS